MSWVVLIGSAILACFFYYDSSLFCVLGKSNGIASNASYINGGSATSLLIQTIFPSHRWNQLLVAAQLSIKSQQVVETHHKCLLFHHCHNKLTNSFDHLGYLSKIFRCGLQEGRFLESISNTFVPWDEDPEAVLRVKTFPFFGCAEDSVELNVS